MGKVNDPSEEKDIRLTEEFKKHIWNSAEDRWHKKALKEGRTYEKKPYISEAERQAAQRRERIAALKAELRQLLTEEEKDSLFSNLKAEHLAG